MIKLIGSVLLMAGASAIGFSAAAYLKARVNCLRCFSCAVAYMERELSFRLTPAPALFRELAAISQPPVNAFFSRCSKKSGELGEKPMSVLWRECVESSKLPLETEELRAVMEIGAIVGRYDGPAQCQALSGVRARIDGMLDRAAEERYRLENVYRALGLSAGAFLLLVLL